MSAQVESLSEKGEVGALPLGHGTHPDGKPEGDNSMLLSAPKEASDLLSRESVTSLRRGE